MLLTRGENLGNLVRRQSPRPESRVIDRAAHEVRRSRVCREGTRGIHRICKIQRGSDREIRDIWRDDVPKVVGHGYLLAVHVEPELSSICAECQVVPGADQEGRCSGDSCDVRPDANGGHRRQVAGAQIRDQPELELPGYPGRASGQKGLGILYDDHIGRGAGGDIHPGRSGNSFGRLCVVGHDHIRGAVKRKRVRDLAGHPSCCSVDVARQSAGNRVGGKRAARLVKFPIPDQGVLDIVFGDPD